MIQFVSKINQFKINENRSKELRFEFVSKLEGLYKRRCYNSFCNLQGSTLKRKKKGYQMIRVSKSFHFLTKLNFFATNEFMSSRLPLRLVEAKTSSLSNFF